MHQEHLDNQSFFHRFYSEPKLCIVKHMEQYLSGRSELFHRCHCQVFCKKVVLKNFAKFTGKDLCWSLFLNKDADLRLAALVKKRL